MVLNGAWVNAQIKDSRLAGWFRALRLEGPLFRQSRFFLWFSGNLGRFPLFKKMGASGPALSFARGLLIALPFLCVIFPRFYISSIGFSRVELRIEDWLIPVMSLFVFWAMARNEDLPELPAVENAFLGFLIVAEISILNGLLWKVIDKPLLSFLYLLKWVEYFLVFIVTVRLIRGRRDTGIFLACFYLLGMAVAVYGYWEHFHPFERAVYPNYYRIFERPPFHGDANHIGGLLVLWIGFFSGVFVHAPKRGWKMFFLASLLFVFFPLIWTYSRKSYFALAGGLAAAFFLIKERKLFSVPVLLFMIFGLLLPTRLTERLMDLPEAITSPDPFHSSWANNWFMWKQAFWNFQHFLLFGSGLGSRHRVFYESQYVLILTEMGIAGMTAFVFFCLTLVKQLRSYWNSLSEPIDQGIAAGWLTGFIGLLIHSASCVSWSVAKIAVPFWFLTAAVFVRLQLAARSHDEQEPC